MDGGGGGGGGAGDLTVILEMEGGHLPTKIAHRGVLMAAIDSHIRPAVLTHILVVELRYIHKNADSLKLL